MATWDQVSNFLKSNFETKEGEGDFLQVLVDFGERSQLVFVAKRDLTKINNNFGVWLELASPIGKLPSSKLDSVLEKLGDNYCGGLVKIGDDYYVSHSMPIEDLSEGELKKPLLFIAIIADLMEKEFIGGDTY